MKTPNEPYITIIINQKGGVGKTTTSTNFATALAAIEKQTLLIDLDPQGNASTGFGINQNNREKNIYEAFFSPNIIEELILPTLVPNLDIIVSNVDLSAVETEFSKSKGRESILKSALKKIKDKYQYIIIDCPPSLGLLTINALMAATHIIIPVQCEFYALEGLSHLLKTIDIFQQINPKLKIQGILLTMYDKRNRLTELVEKDVRSCLKDLVFKTVIPRNVRISEAPSFGKPVIIYDHKCPGSTAYLQLVREILDKKE